MSNYSKIMYFLSILWFLVAICLFANIFPLSELAGKLNYILIGLLFLIESTRTSKKEKYKKRRVNN